jgi:hypothetical protein
MKLNPWSVGAIASILASTGVWVVVGWLLCRWLR